MLLYGLGLIMGHRADSSLVSRGKKRAEVMATFDLSALPSATRWLVERELDDPDAPQQLHIRRTLSEDGRSKAYLNGRPTTLNELKSLSQKLIVVQGQHAQYDLLQPERQLELLDSFGQHQDLKQSVNHAWHELQSARKRHRVLLERVEESSARKALLAYQVEELDLASLAQGEFSELERELKQLSSAGDRAHALETLNHQIKDSDASILSQLGELAKTVEGFDEQTFSTLSKLIQEALINLEEAGHEADSLLSAIEQSPEKLHETDQRMTLLHDLARKHRVEPDALFEHWTGLSNELSQISTDASELPVLEAECERLSREVVEKCKALTEARVKSAHTLAAQVTQQLNELELHDAEFQVALLPTEPSPQGAEKIQFELAANKGGRAGPLAKVASGGELSRVALGIQVCVASQLETPTLIFDEVDVGIGGRTAARVGQLLRSLGTQAQVLAVTHQPQVAGQGQTHWHLSKFTDGNATESQVKKLTAAERVEELARMLAGEKVTDATRANARELLTVDV